jgi:hypothetical protein
MSFSAKATFHRLRTGKFSAQGYFRFVGKLLASVSFSTCRLQSLHATIVRE